MFILHIEHPVPNYDGWKKMFDSDPLDRRQSRVKSYRISRAVDNPNHIVVELEFDHLNEAETMHNSLKKLWGKVEGSIMSNPQSRIYELVENKEL